MPLGIGAASPARISSPLLFPGLVLFILVVVRFVLVAFILVFVIRAFGFDEFQDGIQSARFGNIPACHDRLITERRW